MDHIFSLHAMARNWSGKALWFLTIISLALTFSFLNSATVRAESSPLIMMIEIKGNNKIGTATIMATMKSREGTPFSKYTVQQDIRKLYSIGYFDDINVEIESFEGGVKLIYVFMEKPSIVAIDFQGNDEFKEKDLKEKITLTAGAVANMALITDNAERITSFYQSEGYWLAQVYPIISEVPENSVNITYMIDEGPKVKIDEIIFDGNASISDKAIKKVMKTKEWWIFSFLTGSGVYSKEQIKEDLHRIQELYQSKGFIYIAVSEPKVTLSPDNRKLYLTISIAEGDQFSVGDIQISGNTILSETEIYEPLKTTSGKIFNRTALKEDIDRIIDMYMNRGYARADVNPLIDVNIDKKLANITLSITEGEIFRIGRIDVLGNIKTRDKVVRREMRLDEGDIYNKSLLKRSRQRINNLDYFEGVNINTTPDVQNSVVDVDVDVKEKMTGQLSLGGGYSSLDKFMVTGEVTQTNLFGRGLNLKVSADLSSRRTNFNISFSDPWFMNRPISASFGVYNEKFDYDEYDKKSRGGFIGFGKELSEYVRGNITYRLANIEIEDVSYSASSVIKDQEGTKLTSSISPTISRDTRNNFVFATEGSRNAVYTTVAGLGGDNFFYKALVDSAWFFPVIWDTTFMVRGRAGYADGFNGEELPLYERYYVGGINTVRGLDFGEAGPRDRNGDVIGGPQELIFNFEYIFPIVEELNLKGVVFFDYGSSFDDDEGYDLSLSNMRKTAGAGLRWLSPFGPIRIEWGFNLDPEFDEGDDKLEFSMGAVF